MCGQVVDAPQRVAKLRQHGCDFSTRFFSGNGLEQDEGQIPSENVCRTAEHFVFEALDVQLDETHGGLADHAIHRFDAHADLLRRLRVVVREAAETLVWHVRTRHEEIARFGWFRGQSFVMHGDVRKTRGVGFEGFSGQRVWLERPYSPGFSDEFRDERCVVALVGSAFDHAIAWLDQRCENAECGELVRAAKMHGPAHERIGRSDPLGSHAKRRWIGITSFADVLKDRLGGQRTLKSRHSTHGYVAQEFGGEESRLREHLGQDVLQRSVKV